MKTQLKLRLAGLDTLRALAILSVVAYHLNWRLPKAFDVAGKFGWMGVDLFFVLSGYLIGSQLLRPVQQGQRVALLDFYRKRAYRILPVRCWFGRMRVPGAQLIATLAFSLYLTHKEVAHVVRNWFPHRTEARDWRSVVVYAVSCLAVAGVLYLGVERPFLKLRDRRSGRDGANVDIEARVEPAL